MTPLARLALTSASLIEQQPLPGLFLGLWPCLTFLCRGLWWRLIKILQRVVVIRRGLAIILPPKMVEDLEPLTVYGVEKVLIIAVNLMKEGNLPADCALFLRKTKGNS